MMRLLLVVICAWLVAGYPGSYANGNNDITAAVAGGSFGKMGIANYEAAQGAVCEISSDIPASGYVPGTNYTFTVSTNDTDGYGMVFQVGTGPMQPSRGKVNSSDFVWEATTDASTMSYAICSRVFPTPSAHVAIILTVESVCLPVANAASPVTCTNATDSRVTECESGFFLNKTGTADVCTDCTAVMNASSAVTCTNATDSQVTACEPGFFLHETGTADVCTACMTADDCSSGEYFTGSCNGTSTSDVTECMACTPVMNAAEVTCTNATDSQVTACESGFFMHMEMADDDNMTNMTDDNSTATNMTDDNSTATNMTDGNSTAANMTDDNDDDDHDHEVCQACTPVMNSSGTVMCTNAMDSMVHACESGFFLDENATACTACMTAANCSSGEYLSGFCNGTTTSDVTMCMDGDAPTFTVEFVQTFVNITEDDLPNIELDIAAAVGVDAELVSAEILPARRRRDDHDGEKQVKVTIQAADAAAAQALETQLSEPITYTNLQTGNPSAVTVGEPTVTTVETASEGGNKGHKKNEDDEDVVIAVSVISILIFTFVIVLLFRSFSKSDDDTPALEA